MTERIDEHLKDGILSDDEIAEACGVDPETVKARRTAIDKRVGKARSAKPIRDAISEHLEQSRKARKAIGVASLGLLQHITDHVRSAEMLTADEISKHSQSLVKIDGLLKDSGDATVDAILRVVEADILPEETSAKIITAFESSNESLRRKTRRLFHPTPSPDGQLDLFDGE